MAVPGPVMARLQYMVARSAAASMNVLPLPVVHGVASCMGRGMMRFYGRYRKIALENLQHAFPEKTVSERERIAEESFEHLMQLGVEVMRTHKLIREDTLYRRLDTSGLDPLAVRWLSEDRPMVMVTGHQGNWELLGYSLATLGFPLYAVARKLDNPLIHQWVLSQRQRQGMTIVDKGEATEVCQQVLDANGLVGFVGDQNAGKKGLFVPFFNRLASTFKSIALLAMRYECPVMVGYAHRLPGGRYAIGTTDLIPYEQVVDQPDPVYYLTARYTRGLEKAVRMAPSQYLWAHRRWKHRPAWEMDAHKQPPARIVRQLQSLPWLHKADHERLLSQSQRAE